MSATGILSLLVGNGLVASSLLTPDVAVPVVAIAMGCAVAIAAVIAKQWRRVRQSAYESHLKDLMIQRGMSTEEIERVIRARPETEADAARRGRDDL